MIPVQFTIGFDHDDPAGRVTYLDQGLLSGSERWRLMNLDALRLARLLLRRDLVLVGQFPLISVRSRGRSKYQYDCPIVELHVLFSWLYRLYVLLEVFTPDYLGCKSFDNFEGYLLKLTSNADGEGSFPAYFNTQTVRVPYMG